MKRWLFAVAIAAVASFIVAATASADVSRYQTQTATFTMTRPAGQVGQFDNVWTHDYTVTVNPDGTFEGTGKEYGQDQNGSFSDLETISGTFADGKVSFTAKRQSDGREWSVADAPFGGAVTIGATSPTVSWPIEMKVTAPIFTSFKNHGDYVSQMGGGADAAHSSIGKPVKAGK